MKKKFYFLALLAFLLASCSSSDNSGNRPICIGDQDGVKVWKLRDDTWGGKQYIYFTTPSANHLLEKP